MRWQHWARGAIVLAGLGCAVAVYVLFAPRQAPGTAPPPAIEPSTTSQMAAGDFKRSKDGRDSLHVWFEGRTTFEDGRMRLDKAHFQSFDQRGLEMWADVVETKGKSIKADNPALFEMTGHVRLHMNDGLEALMDHATYNDVTGVLTTPGAMTFTKGRMSGGGVGATYEQTPDVLTLLDRAHVVIAPDAQGAGALDATSRRLTLNRPVKVVRLDDHARIVRDGDTLSGDLAVVHTTEDESRLTRIELRANARVTPGDGKGASAPPHMSADDIDLDLHDDGQTIRHADMTGRTAVASVDMTGTDAAHRKIAGSHITFDLARDGQTLTGLDAVQQVAVTLPKTADAEARTIHADTLHAIGKEPGGLTSADFDGGPMRPVRFEEDVPQTGSAAVKTRTVASQRLVLRLKGQLDAIENATFLGAVDLRDPNATAGADVADYDATDKTNRKMRLRPATGATRTKPWAENAADRRVEAWAIDLFLDSATNDLDAEGSVATITKPAPPAPGQAVSPLFSGDTPIVGEGAKLQYRGNEGTYTGAPRVPARVKQGASFVIGDKVVFQSDTNNLTANGHVESNMLADGKDSTGQAGGPPSEYRIRNADSLKYDDGQRVAEYRGKPVRLHSEDGDTSALSVRITFAPDSRQVQQMNWDGSVTADLTGRRRGVGDNLTYDAATDVYVLTGKPAQGLFPKSEGGPLCTHTAGNKLTFNRVSGDAEGGLDTTPDVKCDEPLPYKKKAGMATLRTEGLTKSYGGRTVVRDINLDVSSGEIVGLLGPNGAGKTTTFSMVVGLTGADAGQVLLDDRRVTSDPMYVRARKGIGYLPQEASIFRGLTVEQNVLAILETQPIGAAERRRRLTQLLGELNLTPLARAKAHTLSGGERRRVEITRALVSQPKFMLLDEPFAGIDPIAVGDIQKIIFHLRDRGIGVLITDHNVRETLKITDRAYIVHDGAIFRSGTPAGLAADEEVKRIYLGADFRLD